MILVVLLLSPALATPPGAPSSGAADPTATLEVRRATQDLRVVRSPEDATLRGRISEGADFYVIRRLGPVAQPGGCEEGWAELELGAFACLDGSEPSARAPELLPRLVAYDAPLPSEYETYRDQGTYERTPTAELSPDLALVPFIYGKRWRSWRGPVYASPEAFAAGEPPVRRLGGVRKFGFVGAQDTARGEVLLRDDGTAVPSDQVFLYPISRHAGVDLWSSPAPEPGLLPAWAVGYQGSAVYSEPGGEALRSLDYHESLWVEPEPVDDAGRWWRIPESLGGGVVEDRNGVRHWVPSPRPEGVSEQQLWLDVDLGQQVIALRRGEALEYVTLTSTGLGRRWATPKGLYRVMDKSIYGDMASRAGAEEPYYVEHVPWVIHFRPRYALHGVFWHWGFGHQASHGCVNLSPTDARALFERIDPRLPVGWHTVYEAPDEPGTLLRIRDGVESVPDRRRALQ